MVILIRLKVTDQSDKVQQVHARFVGLGVCEGQEGQQLEAHSISCSPSLLTEELDTDIWGFNKLCNAFT